MPTVLVVCGAGASSTFLALAMRKQAANRGIPLRIEPVGESQLPGRLDDADAMLVGPHLSARYATLQSQAAGYGVPATLLPDGDTGVSGAERALGAALALLGGPPIRPAAVHPSTSIAIPATTTRTE